MRFTLILLSTAFMGLVLSGCIPATPAERNPYLTLAETLGIAVEDDDGTGGRGGPGGERDVEFRSAMDVTFSNLSLDAELNTSMIAWVEVGSIRSADQQDILLSNGYVQLTSEVRLGNAFTLPAGTFVYNGPGVAGATTIFLRASQQGQVSNRTISLVTPDAILVFSQPPVSCDDVAFFFTIDGEVPTSPSVPGKGGVILFSGATGNGPLKTLAQIQGTQCDPLRPGFFLKRGGGTRNSNEFFEGENLEIDFSVVPDANGDFALVTFS